MPRKTEPSPLPAIDWSRFDGIRAPTYTQTPDEIFDWIMAFLTGAELKVLLYITRRTFGFKKNADAISVSQLCTGIVTRDGRRLDWGTGLERSTVLKALHALEEKHLIVRHQQADPAYGSQPSLYALNVKLESVGAPIALAAKGGGSRSIPPSTRITAGVDPDPPGSRLLETGGVDAVRYPPVVGITPQETVEQNTVKQQTEPSNIRTAMPESGTRLTTRQASNTTPPAVVTEGRISTDHSKRQQSQRPQWRLNGEYASLTLAITDIAREFGDEAPLRASISRARNILHDAGIKADESLALLYEARMLTRVYQAGITKTRADSGQLRHKNLMPYFFAVLDDLAHPEQHAAKSVEPNTSMIDHTSITETMAPTDESIWSDDSTEAAAADSDQEMHPIWRMVLSELAQTITSENFRTWLAPTRALKQEGNVLRVAVPQAFHKRWLELKFRDRIASTMRRLGYDDLDVEYVVMDAIES